MEPRDPTLTLARGTVDLRDGLVRTDRGAVALTDLERELLRYLAAHAGRAVDRDELLAEVWGYREGARSRTVEVTVGRLRAKIEPDPSNPRHLVTVRGAGYQLVPWQASIPAPPEPTAGRGSAFPGLLEPLIDRAVELRAARNHLVDGGRWLTVSGSPGIGKTWFARALVGEIADAGRAEVAFVDLTERSTAADVREAIEAELAAPLAAWLGGAPSAVWLLDAADRVDLGAVRLLERCLHQAPRLAIVATSQAAIGVEGEVTTALPPLSPTDGAALFRRRLGAAGVPAPDDATLVDLAERLEGLPLAIDVASPWLAVHPPSAVGLADLVAAPHPRRTGRSLAEVVGAAVERLDRPTRAALGALAVFTGLFDRAAAEAVAGRSVGAALTELHRRSLVRKHGLDGFALAPAVRAVAPAPDPDARRRLADHLEQRLATVLAERAAFGSLRPYRADLPGLLALDLPDATVAALGRLLSTLLVRYGPPLTPPILVDRFERAAPALRALLAVRLSDLARVRGELDEGDRIAALGLACGPPPRVRVALLRARIQACQARGDLDTAEALCDDAMTTADACNDPDALLIALESIAATTVERDPERALAVLDRLVATAIAARNPDAALLGEINAGWANAALGRFADGLVRVEAGLARDAGDTPRSTAAAHAIAGLLHAALGDEGRAEQALAVAERLGTAFTPCPPTGLVDARALLALRRGEDPEPYLAALDRWEPERGRALRAVLGGAPPTDGLDAVFAGLRVN